MHPASRILNPASRKLGFTLTEIMIAVTISVFVFAAMGALLGRCFSLWKDAAANWQLAQYSRVSRERILRGGFADPSQGLLSATNAVPYVPGSGWAYLQYRNQAGGLQRVYGWVGESTQNIWLYRTPGTPAWTYAQGSSYPVNPPVTVDSFDLSKSNQLVTITYRVRASAGGKTFTQPHTIQAYLINED